MSFFLVGRSINQLKIKFMDRSIENLFIWNESRAVVNDIYTMMNVCKDYSFKDQLQRAAISIMNNIAEGAESGSDAKFISFLKIARGSCSEVRSMLYLCEDFNYCNKEERIIIQNRIKTITVGAFKLIKILSNK
jgi:four helix bundle protein